MASSISPDSSGVKFVPEENNFLQRHASFFDRNKDGIVYPAETFQGLRAIGCGYFLSAFGCMFINMGLSRKSRPGKGFSFLFPIEIENIHLAKHGSVTGVYDMNGRFVPSKFEEIFLKHANTHPNALTKEELTQLLDAIKEPNDRKGWIAGYTQWTLLYHLCKDKNGFLSKESVRAIYDGSIFDKLETQRSSTKHL